MLELADPTAYELNGGNFSTYGFQYKPGFGDAVSHDALVLNRTCVLTLSIVYLLDL